MPGGGTLCIVANCKSNSKRAKQGDQLIRFFSFPSKPSLEEEWVKACQQKKNFDPKVKKVCSLHFKKGDFEDELKAQIMSYSPKKLKKGAIPSLNLPSAIVPGPGSTTSPQANPGRAKRNVSNMRTELVEECLKQYNEIQVKNTTNKRKEKVSYLNTKEIQPSLILKKKKRYPVKLKKQSSEDKAEEQPKETASEVQSGVSDGNANQKQVQSGYAKKRKRTPVKLKKQSVQDSSDDESFSNNKASEVVQFSRSDKMAGYSVVIRKHIEKEVVSYFGRDQVITSEVCSNKNCQRQLKALDEEIDSLKKIIISNSQIKADLENKLCVLQKKLDSRLDSSFEEKAKELFKDFLSSNQIHVALKKKTKPWWTKEDMSKAFSILYFSKRCYLHLRNTLNYPLPGLSTLRKWTSGMNKAYPLESNPLDPPINFEMNNSDEDEQEQNAHSNSSDHPIDSRNLASEESSPKKNQQLENVCFIQCNSDHLTNSENPSAGESNSIGVGNTQVNDLHSIQYSNSDPENPPNQGGDSNENLDLVDNQILTKTTENISNNSKNLPSKGKISKNVKLKRRRPLIASKKFEFQSYLKNYLNKKNLITTPSSSAKEKPFTCSICRLGFDKNIALQRHYKIHASEDPWKCDVCEDVFISKYYLEKHILTHKDDNNKYVCDICNRSFIQKNSFKDHYLLHRNLQPHEPLKESPKKGEQTVESTVALPNANMLGSETPAPNSSLVSTEHASPKDKPYSCHVCNESFVNKSSLKSHLPVHGQKIKKMFRKRYNCTTCNKEFKFRLSFQKHIQTCGVDLSTLKGPLPVSKRVKKVFNKLYTCPTCNKVFKFHHSFEKHLQTCEEKKVYMCEVCDKTFSHPWSARRHMLLHDQETWFYCEICNKGFKQRYYLKQHMIVHSGEKPFVCEWCDKRFAQNSTLKKHLEAHKNGSYSKSTTQSKKSKVETPSTSVYPNTNYSLNPNAIRNPMEMPSCASFPNTNYPIDPNLKRNPMEMPSSSYYYLTQL